MKKIAVIGECMVEFYQENNTLYQQGFGGDTFNFSVYLKRELPDSVVEYITVLGQDSLSEKMLSFFHSHNIGTSYIDIHPHKKPGLYIVDTINGERSFSYWRNNSAAKNLFATKSTTHIINQILNYDLIYYSAITLAIMEDENRERFFSALEHARKNGVKVVFDSNYRKSLYKSSELARDLYNKALTHCDIFLPSIDDESSLWHDKDYRDVIQRATSFGCHEVVITNGGNDIISYADNEIITHTATTINAVIDTTSAGDSFNAAYICARLRNFTITDAVQNGQALAAKVIMHKGAII